MSDLRFTTQGQEQVLAAQQQLRKGAREYKEEIEAGLKATQQWDENWAKLKRQGETALRSIQTEQERLLDSILKIEDAAARGLVPPDEAQEGIRRLKQQWIEVDEATVKAREATDQYEREQAELKNAAEAALGSVRTELESIQQKIADVEAASAKGLITPEQAEEGLRRLNGQLNDTKLRLAEAETGTSRLNTILLKAFNPETLVKWGAGLFGVKAIIAQLRAEFDDFQTAIDKRSAAYLEPEEKEKKFASDVESAAGDVANTEEALARQRKTLEDARADEAQQQAERREQIEERISDLTEQLARAQQDRQAAIQDAAKQQEEARDRLASQYRQAQLALDRAIEDLGYAKTPQSRRGAQRRVDDARARLDALDAEVAGEGPSLTGYDRRIADLERDISRARRDLAAPGGGDRSAAAAESLAEAEREYAAALRKKKDLEQQQAEFLQSPEYGRYKTQQQIGEAFDQLYKDIIAVGDQTQVSSEDLEKFADALREVGQGDLARKFTEFIARIDDGTISIDEVVEEMRRQIDLLRTNRDPSVQAQFTSEGGDILQPPPVPVEDLNTKDRAAVEALNRAISVLERIDNKIDPDGGGIGN